MKQPEVEKLYKDKISTKTRPYLAGAEEGLQYDGYNDRRIPIVNINMDLANCKSVGIDLPVWFKAAEPQNTVMLVAMEPLRNHDFPEEGTIAAPFALHQSKQRAGGTVLLRFIVDLLQNDNSVYITDAWKIYSKRENVVFHGDEDTNRIILQEEFDILKSSGWNPGRVIALGKSSYNSLTNLLAGSNYHPEYMRHPWAWGKKLNYYEHFSKS